MVVKRWTAARLGLWLALVSAGVGCSSSRQVTRSVTVDQPAPVVHPNWTASSEAVAGPHRGTASGASPSAESTPSAPAPRILRERILEGRAAPVAPQQEAIVQTQAEELPTEPAPVGPAAPIGNPLVANLLSEDHRLRLTTIEVIEEAARDGYAFQDEVPDANGVTVVVTLRWLAYGYDAKGAWIESSPDVRRRAMAAIALVDPANAEFNKPYCVDPNGVDLAAVAPVAMAAASSPQPDATGAPVAGQPAGGESVSGEVLAVAEPPVDTAIVREIPEIPDSEPEMAVVEESPEAKSTSPAAEHEVIDVLALTDTGAAETGQDSSASDPQEAPAPAAEPTVVGEPALAAGAAASPATPTDPNLVDEPVAASVSTDETTDAAVADSDVPTRLTVSPEAAAASPEAESPVVEPPARELPVVAEPAVAPEPKPATQIREMPRTTEARATVSGETNVRPIAEPATENTTPSSAPPAAAQSVIPVDEPRSAGPLKGTIVSVEPRLGTAWVKLDSPRGVLPAGQRLVVIHRYPLGRLSSMGEVEVIRANTTHAEVRVIGGTPIAKVAVGDQVNSPSR